MLCCDKDLVIIVGVAFSLDMSIYKYLIKHIEMAVPFHSDTMSSIESQSSNNVYFYNVNLHLCKEKTKERKMKEVSMKKNETTLTEIIMERLEDAN